MVHVLLLLGRLPLVGDVEVLVKVGEHVDGEGVELVQLVVVGHLDGLDGAGVVGELDEDVALGLALRVQRVVLVHHLAELGEDLLDHRLQLFQAVGAHVGDAVHHDDRVHAVGRLGLGGHQLGQQLGVGDVVDKVLVVGKVGLLVVVDAVARIRVGATVVLAVAGPVHGGNLLGHDGVSKERDGVVREAVVVVEGGEGAADAGFGAFSPR